MQTIQLLSLQDSLSLLFENNISLSKDFMIENAAPDVQLADEPAPDGDALSAVEDEPFVGDRRQKLHRAQYDVHNKISKINKMRKLAHRLGLDNVVKQMIISIVSQERYDEVSRFGGPDKEQIEAAAAEAEAAGKIPAGMSKQDFKKKLELRGYLTIAELNNIYNDLTVQLMPKLAARAKSHKQLVNKAPALGKLFNINVDADINLEFENRNSHEIENIKLGASEPLSERVATFNKALQMTDPEVAVRLAKKFKDVFVFVAKNLGTLPDYAGPEKEGQRVYTASLYALYHVAPEFNITAMTKAREKQAKKAAEEQKAQEAKQEEERKRTEKEHSELEELKRKAETDYKSKVRIILKHTPEEKIKQAEAVAYKYYNRPIKIESALFHLDESPQTPDVVKVSNQIRTMLGIPDKKQFLQDAAEAIKKAAVIQGSPTPPVVQKVTPQTTATPAPPGTPPPGQPPKPTNESVILDIVDPIF